MLPNLAAVRRPSKSAIVNSSIALIHNQSRARVIAARELRLLNAEANALRAEVNEWRMRNSLPRVEEPIRSTDFATLLAVEDVEMGEEMVLGQGRRSFDEGFLGANEDDGGFDEEGEEGDLINPETGVYGNMGLPVRGVPMQYQPQQQQQQQQAQAQAQQQQQRLFEQQKAAMARAHQAQLAQQQAQAQARYSPPIHQQPHHQHSQSQPASMFPADIYAASATAQANEIYNPSWSQKAIASLTPSGSAHGQGAKASAFANTANSAFLSGPHQQGMYSASYNNAGFLGVSGTASTVGSDDDHSDGSSHFSSVSDLMGGNPEQSISFGLSTNNSMGGFNNVGMGMMGYGMGNMGMMQLPPSPPHTGSPGSNTQSRRASVNIPANSAKSSPGPSPVPVQYGMPLMI